MGMDEENGNENEGHNYQNENEYIRIDLKGFESYQVQVEEQEMYDCNDDIRKVMGVRNAITCKGCSKYCQESSD